MRNPSKPSAGVDSSTAKPGHPGRAARRRRGELRGRPHRAAQARIVARATAAINTSELCVLGIDPRRRTGRRQRSTAGSLRRVVSQSHREPVARGFESQRAQNMTSLGSRRRSQRHGWNSSSVPSPRTRTGWAPNYAANSQGYAPPDAAATASSRTLSGTLPSCGALVAAGSFREECELSYHPPGSGRSSISSWPGMGRCSPGSSRAGIRRCSRPSPLPRSRIDFR